MPRPLTGLAVPFDAALFLRRYWQRRPLLIRQALPGFQPELTADDIAGLACEADVDSRLVSGSSRRNWKVRHGPFTAAELSRLPARGWTLLVQNVEKHYPPLQQLLAGFSFIPGWRVDDLMASVSPAGGSVGPHSDQYDVFLLQASGRKRWQVALDFDPSQLPGCELNVLRHFRAEQEWVLDPGDVLYLPPGVAHHGVALEPGMTWSIGMRAPSQADLLQSFGEWLAEERAEGRRFTDPPLPRAPRPGEIRRAAVDRLRALMLEGLRDRPGFEEFIGRFLSSFRLGPRPEAPAPEIAPRSLRARLRKGAALQRSPWTRMAWIARRDRARLFADGEAWDCDIALAKGLCAWPLRLPAGTLEDHARLQLLSALLARGHLEFGTQAKPRRAGSRSRGVRSRRRP